MSTIKKLSVTLSSLALAVIAPVALAQTYTLNVSTSQVADDPMYKGLLEFKKNVEARSGGRIAVKTFPASQLGSDEDIVEQIKAGAGVALVTDGARLEPYTKEFGILTAPYVVKSAADMRKFTTSAIFETWVKKLHDTGGFQVFSFNWYQGERHLVTNKPITKPADLAGIRMRTPGAPLWLETVRGLGATPTPMPWAEAYSALQLKAIDAVEVQLPSIWGSRLYEVTKYVTKTRHIQLVTGLVGSAAWFDKLPKDLQTIVREESLKAGDYATKITNDNLATYEKDIKAKGMVVTEIDPAAFMASTKGVYDKFGYVELRKQIDDIVAK
ncbi:MAG: C4-dicarboxylate TRAP transporter substrate-binding protein [Moraxellaceae bacterium]|nr:C4-dicarboxylate TRAP transporter substrate-binding protein [Moraxellaceae bacterium]